MNILVSSLEREKSKSYRYMRAQTQPPSTLFLSIAGVLLQMMWCVVPYGHEGRRIRLKPKAAVQLGPYRQKADRQQGDVGSEVGLSRGCRAAGGRIGRRLTNSEAPRAVGLAEAEAAEQLEP